MLLGERRMTQHVLVDIKSEEMVRGVVLLSPDGVIAASSEVSDIGKITDTDEIRRTLQLGEASIWTEKQNGQNKLWVITPVFNKLEC